MKLPPLPIGVSLKLAQAEGILGGSIWPSAGELCKHLLDDYYCVDNSDASGTVSDCYDRTHFHRSWNVLELGSGTGAVGLFAAGLGIFQSVHLSEHRPPMAAAISSVPYNVDGTLDWELLRANTDDMENEPEMARSDRLLKLLQQNVDQSGAVILGGSGSDPSSWPPHIHELDWAIPEHVPTILEDSGCPHGFELLLASDVTYVSELHDALATTIAQLLRNTTAPPSTPLLEQSNLSPVPKCLVAHQQRVLNLRGEDYQLERFQSAVKNAGLEIDTVHRSSENPSLSILELCHAHQSSNHDDDDDDRSDD